MPEERLDKVVASICRVSRSDARKIIRSGRVRVLGSIVTDIGFKTDTANTVAVDGTEQGYSKFVYIMLNKPAGIISASNDKSRKTVVDIVSGSYRRNALFPVGRLDKDTTGLLIITDDGDFGHRVISPKSMIEKEYTAVVDKPLTDGDIEKLRCGVTLADGTKCRPAKVYTVSDDRRTVGIVLTEGKYHEIKRMLGTVGAGVNELKRIRIGNILLDDSLDIGMYRELTTNELSDMWKLLKIMP